ncbi:MAG TPA: tetratricopeptide repeat protein, partial [Myxococcota bacterium]|nr:tetratricopeptide repeat protein [Myxococcota bacterium]
MQLRADARNETAGSLRASGRTARAAGLRSALTVVLVVSLALVGCASWPGLPGAGGAGASARRVPLRIERSRMPADYDVLVGELAQARGDFEAARAAYERAAQKDPDSGFLHDRLARLAWQLDDVEGALREAELAFALDPESRRSRLFLGRLYRLRRDFEGLDRVLRDEAGAPLDADSAHALYQVAMERGDLEEAEALAKRLAELEPDQLRGILALASVHEQRRDWDAAIAVVRKGLESFPDHFLLFMRLAQI